MEIQAFKETAVKVLQHLYNIYPASEILRSFKDFLSSTELSGEELVKF